MHVDGKISAARAIAAQLRTAEEAIDSALAENARLIETCIFARRDLRIASGIAIETHQHIVSAMQAMTIAQQHMSAAHEALVSIQHRVGLGKTAIVPAEDKPDDGEKPIPAGRLYGRFADE